MHAGGSHNSKESLRLIIMSMAMFLDIYMCIHCLYCVQLYCQVVGDRTSTLTLHLLCTFHMKLMTCWY